MLEERNQVIVLSHDKDFLLSLSNKYSQNNTKNNNEKNKNITLLKINHYEKDGSKIEKMEQLDLITQGYIKDVIDIRNYILRSQGDSIEIKIRRLIEEEIKRRNPELYEQATPNYMATLKSTDKENPFTDDERKTIGDILDYANSECHSGSKRDEQELKKYAKDTLKVLKIRYKSTETPEEK
ncbi:MAG: hypothetical protein J6P29_05690 [Acetobacter sp.]|nr:hypothetical protein [Acetobacter sp.]